MFLKKRGLSKGVFLKRKLAYENANSNKNKEEKEFFAHKISTWICTCKLGKEQRA